VRPEKQNRRSIIFPLCALLIAAVAGTADAQQAQFNPYGFPSDIDPSKRFVFYLHGQIVEDQDFPVISPKFGVYDYAAILKRLSFAGSVVISEKRPANTQVSDYAMKVSQQIDALLAADVPSESITVVGASKGSYIAATVSYIQKNSKLTFVLLGSCHSSVLADWKNSNMRVYGNILAIRDYMDTDLAGSCDRLISLSQGPDLGVYREITLSIGIGHGILYKPLELWIAPTIQWAKGDRR
jgi:hypothetical protein